MHYTCNSIETKKCKNKPMKNTTAVPGNVQVTLNWSGFGTASSYNVKRSLVNNGTYSNIATNVRSTSYTDANVVNETRYYYVVSAVNLLGQSANSAQVF